MKKNNRGFTLVELVVSITLLALILIPTAGFFTNSFKVQSKSSLKTSITRVGQYIIENFKNKNYLADTLKAEDGTGFQKFLDRIKLDEDGKDFSDSSVKDDSHWNLNYNKVDYIVDVKIEDFETADISDLNIPNKEECDGIVKITESGIIYTIDEFGNIVSIDGIKSYEVGESFNSPNDNKSYKANYPTIVLDSEFLSSESATLWIINEGYYNDTDGDGIYDDEIDRQKYIRIVKGFDNELKVYKENINFMIQEGQEGDMASKSRNKIDSVFVGETSEGVAKKSSSELWLNAKMTVTNKQNADVRDTFEFSFPINYDYSEAGNQ